MFEGLEVPPSVPFHPKKQASPAPEPAPDRAPRFQLLSVAELHRLPRLTWAIHGVLPATGCAAIYGPSGSGKSFLELDLVAALTEMGDWFGHKVRVPLRVVIIVLEGEAGFRNRVEAWEIVHNRPFPEQVQFVFQPFRLNDRADCLALAAAIDHAGGTDVVVVDTLNRAAPGTDENSSRDMGIILDHCNELQRMFGGLLLLVHHTGKDAAKGMRGHSSLHAALDAAIEVTRTDDRREWTLAKSKDGADGQPHGFFLEVVHLDDDDDGEPVTSCAVRSDDTPVVHRPRLPKGGNQRIIYDALNPLFRDSRHFGMAGAPPTRPCIRLDDAIAATKDSLAVEAKRRPERTRLAITGLIATHVLDCKEDWIWLR
ncbi:AAA family ATPase [Polaromonas sp. JS666]|uniref:AAA family ATPase n=1 Tax=Polaromonas sp. (strain JS666 / ATCC BAA-500) TaxID=296591 RepID=UPI001E5F92FE|nr:AAA family ATPase [Polaromonas sp. JS666]